MASASLRTTKFRRLIHVEPLQNLQARERVVIGKQASVVVVSQAKQTSNALWQVRSCKRETNMFNSSAGARRTKLLWAIFDQMLFMENHLS